MSVSDELERLNALFMKGALSSEEYAQAKARVLGQASAGQDSTGQGATSQSAPDATFGGGAGASPGTGHTPGHNTGGFLHRLTRSSADRVLGGVCGGLGAHTGLPSWAWRLMFCVTAIYFGIGVLFYILMWIFIPQEGATP